MKILARIRISPKYQNIGKQQNKEPAKKRTFTVTVNKTTEILLKYDSVRKNIHFSKASVKLTKKAIYLVTCPFTDSSHSLLKLSVGFSCVFCGPTSEYTKRMAEWTMEGTYYSFILCYFKPNMAFHPSKPRGTFVSAVDARHFRFYVLDLKGPKAMIFSSKLPLLLDT